MKNTVKIILFFLLALSLFSCRKEFGSASWDIDVSAPLIHSSLTINNLLADSLIQQEADSSLTIVYNNTLYSFSVDSLVDIPDTIKQVVFHIPIDIVAQPNQQIINTTDNKILDLGDAVVTKIIIKSGYVNLDIKNTIAEKVLCQYNIPCASNNGTPLELTDLVPASTSSGPTMYTRSVDISGYTFDLTGTDGTGANILTSIIQAWIDPNGNPVNITHLDSLSILATFNSLVIDYAKGYFGTQTIESGIKTSDFDLFKNITDGSLLLEDLHLVLSVTNGFGVDASLLIHEIKSVNSHNGNTVTLNSSIINSLININRAQETYNPSSPVNPTHYNFNLDNSNFKQLIENLPDKIEYSLDVTTNPLGNVSGGNDFIYNGFGFNANLDLEIPLSVIATNLTLTDTIDFHLSEPEGYSVNSGMLTLFADNGFPFSATSQIYLLDENNLVTDSLMTLNNTIVSAPLDAQDKAIGKKETQIKIAVNGNRLDNLFHAKKIILTVKFNTAHPGHYIKIYSNYAIDMILTGDFNMTVNEH
ncbi:MAG: hypothetical protein V1904_10690 [Bacteroidota bacterium]